MSCLLDYLMETDIRDTVLSCIFFNSGNIFTISNFAKIVRIQTFYDP